MELRKAEHLTSGGYPINTAPDKFGPLLDSTNLLNDIESLRARFEKEGYIFLPGYLDPKAIMQGRMDIARKLSEEGCLDQNSPVCEMVARHGLEMCFRADIAMKTQSVLNVIYSKQVMTFYDRLLGGPATHYDYTWMRAVAPGKGTQPHCDIVYMGRGTPNVCTAWIPFGDISLEMGGLIILEGSHKVETLKSTYGTLDVDTACSGTEGNQLQAHGFLSGGAISKNPIELQAELTGKWLTSEFKMGDFLTFNMFLVHASLDNNSNAIRLSTDSRYQLASEPIDERWIGESPPSHGGAMVRNTIC